MQWLTEGFLRQPRHPSVTPSARHLPICAFGKNGEDLDHG